MTIKKAPARSQQTSAAGSTKFSFNFQFNNEIDLKVYKTLSGAIPDDNADILSLNVDYTVQGAGWGNDNLPRSITLTVGASVGDTITIYREMDIDRTTDFSVSGQFSAEDLNNQFDSIVAMIQQIQTERDQLGLYYINSAILTSTNQNILPKLPSQSGTDIPIWSANSSGTLVASSLTESSGFSTLRSDLANNSSGSDGALLSGYYNAALAPANTTVASALDGIIGSTPVPGQFGAIGQVIFGYFTSLSGWLAMDDGTIGPVGSGADHESADYEDLFIVLWDSSALDPEWMPVSSGRGATALDDWNNGTKTIGLPRLVERGIAVKGQATLTSEFNIVGPPSYYLTVEDTSIFTSGMRVQFTTTDTLPTGISLSTDYYITIVSATTLLISTTTILYTGGNPLSPSATGGHYIQSTDAGIGTHTMNVQFDNTKAIGEYEGYHNHIMTTSELVEHSHTIDTEFGSGSGKIGYGGGNADTAGTNNSGLSEESSLLSPMAYMNAYIKYQ